MVGVNGITGEDLARMRVARNLTQAEVAEQAGCAQATICKLECGRHVSKKLFARVYEVVTGTPLPQEQKEPAKVKKKKKRKEKRADPVEPGKYGWCQLCEELAQATRLVEIKGSLYALCDNHKREDVTVWLTQL